MSAENKPNLNTILLVIGLGVMSWQAKTTFESSLDLAAIKTTLTLSHDKDVNQDVQLESLRARITACEIALAKLNGGRTP
jgi:hypothetical protein